MLSTAYRHYNAGSTPAAKENQAAATGIYAAA